MQKMPAFWCGQCDATPLCLDCGVGSPRRKNYFRENPRGGSKERPKRAPRPVELKDQAPKTLES